MRFCAAFRLCGGACWGRDNQLFRNNSMKNIERLIYGLSLTLLVFVVAVIPGSRLPLRSAVIPSSFITHSIMLLLSLVLIVCTRKQVDYRFSVPKIKRIVKPFLFGFVASVAVNFIMVVLTKKMGGKVEGHAALATMNPLQTFLFVFLYASIAEEFLFRGFLMNILKPMKTKGFTLFKKRISVPVLVSSIAFSLAHLVLIATGANVFFLVRILLFTFVLGLIAGYYQEKNDNHAFAIIVHMSGNLMAVVSALLMSCGA